MLLGSIWESTTSLCMDYSFAAIGKTWIGAGIIYSKQFEYFIFLISTMTAKRSVIVRIKW